jgi:cell division protein FtsW (lipid II flippase)
MMTLFFPETKDYEALLKAAKESVALGDGQGVIVAYENSEGIRAASFKTLMILVGTAFVAAAGILALPVKKKYNFIKYAVVGFCALLIAVFFALHMGRAAEAQKWASAVEEAKKTLDAQAAAVAADV